MAEDDDETLELNTEGLDRLAKSFKKLPVINVGILGSKNQRTPEPGAKQQLTNAQVGAFHEFGTSRVPQRSFLRIPLIDWFDKRVKSSGLLTKKSIEQVVKTNSLLQLMKKLALIAEDVVLGAFDSGGYGKWAPLKPETLAKKKNHQILVETQQLRNSISSEVTEGGPET